MGNRRGMDGLFRVLGFVLGLMVVVGTLSSVFTTLVVPRAGSSRLLRAISKVMVREADHVVRILRTYESRDRVMSVVGPFCMVLLFVVWLSSLVVGFGLVAWWLSGSSLLHSFAASASSVFTLGIATLQHRFSEVIELVAAGTGLLVVALEIAYLPTLYSAFSALRPRSRCSAPGPVFRRGAPRSWPVITGSGSPPSSPSSTSTGSVGRRR